MKNCCCAPEGLEHEIAHLPQCLQSIHPRHYWLDFSKPSIQERTLPALQTAILPPPKEGPTINHVVDLMDQLHSIHCYAHQHLKLASD